MAFPTMHFRNYGEEEISSTITILQQLFVFSEQDAHILNSHSLNDVDLEISDEDPNHRISFWLKTIPHEWRNVPRVFDLSSQTREPKGLKVLRRFRELKKEDVKWVTNEKAELGVKIGNQFFWLYKGESSVIHQPGVGGNASQWRYVAKREFGEVCNPVEQIFPEASDWQPLPVVEETEEDKKLFKRSV